MGVREADKTVATGHRGVDRARSGGEEVWSGEVVYPSFGVAPTDRIV